MKRIHRAWYTAYRLRPCSNRTTATLHSQKDSLPDAQFRPGVMISCNTRSNGERINWGRRSLRWRRSAGTENQVSKKLRRRARNLVSRRRLLLGP